MTARQTAHKRANEHDDAAADEFYEVMPYAPSAPYADWADSEDAEDDAPDKDFASIQDEGKTVAIQTLVFVALATLAICALLIWGVEAARQTFPPDAAAGLH